ncbi:MAG: hypothetical protein K2X37_08715 [Chitinophagaceae bacterium]|nr:hypothetical protein [Chitinophagaceae bacterium]
MIRPLFIIAALTLGIGSFGQSTSSLLPDQNPNYLASQEKYTKIKDSLLFYSNTTIQDTYKAYDWYQARIERRNNRRVARWDRNRWNDPWAYNRPLNWGYYNNGFGINNGWNNWGWNNPWNGGWGFRPTIGFRTGNWFFGF